MTETTQFICSYLFNNEGYQPFKRYLTDDHVFYVFLLRLPFQHFWFFIQTKLSPLSALLWLKKPRIIVFITFNFSFPFSSFYFVYETQLYLWMALINAQKKSNRYHDQRKLLIPFIKQQTPRKALVSFIETENLFKFILF